MFDILLIDGGFFMVSSTGTKEKSLKNVYFLTGCALMAAVLCIVSPISIPIGEVPVSLATFIIYLTVWLLGTYGSTVSVIVYLLIGMAGLPVFSNGGSGLGKLSGPTGGYLIGYVFLALISGIVMKLCRQNMVITIIGMVAATAVLYAFGTAWFILQLDTSLKYALTVCVWPFIPFDMAKIICAAIVGKPARLALKKAGLSE